jgi:iron complex transport system substrate-binding protein
VQRLLPLAPDVTELAFTIGAGDRVIAVVGATDFPAAARSLPKIRPDDAEAILALRPDLVIATTAGNDPRVIARLRDVGVRVCVVDVTSFSRLVDACRLVGEVTGLAASGRQLAQEIGTRVARAAAAAGMLPYRRALYVVWWDPLIVAAPGSFHDDLLGRANLENLAPRGGGRYPQVDPELLLDPCLEVVVAPEETDLRAGFDRVRRSPAGARLDAGQVRVIWLPADPASRPGPRLADALDALVAARQELEKPAGRGGGPGGASPPPHRDDPGMPARGPA